MANQIDILVKARDEASQTLRGIQGSTGELGKSLDGLSSTSNAAFSTVKLGAIAAGAAVAVGFAAAIKSASGFEHGLSAVKAVSGATADEMKLLSDKALQIGKDTAFSASQAVGAMEELVKAGLSVDDVLGGAADAAVALAAAGGVTIPEAATLAANAMNAFGIEAKDMVGVVDLIAGAANASAIDVGEFGFSLQMVGAVANLAGISFNDTATAIALMGNAGIKGSDAGTSLKTMLMNLSPATDTAREAFEKLGIITAEGVNQFINADGSMKGLAEISGILKVGVDKLTDSEALMALKMAFGTDAVRAAAIMAKEGAEGFETLNAEMLKTSAADVAAARMDNMAGSVEALKGSVETLAIQLGQKLIPMLTSATKTATDVVNAFMGLPESVQNGVLAIGGLVLALKGLGVTLGLVGVQLTFATGGVAALSAALVILATDANGSRTALKDHFDSYEGYVRQGTPVDKMLRGIAGLFGKELPQSTKVAQAAIDKVNASFVDFDAIEDKTFKAFSRNIQSTQVVSYAGFKKMQFDAQQVATYMSGTWGPILGEVFAGASGKARKELEEKLTGSFPPVHASAETLKNYLEVTWGPETAKVFEKTVEDIDKQFDNLRKAIGTIVPTVDEEFGKWVDRLNQMAHDHAAFELNLKSIYNALVANNVTMADALVATIAEKGPQYAAFAEKFLSTDPERAAKALQVALPAVTGETWEEVVKRVIAVEPEMDLAVGLALKPVYAQMAILRANIGDDAALVGAEIAAGMASGITTNAWMVEAAAQAAAGDALAASEMMLGIQSPSREFAEIGEAMSEGMAVGILAGLPFTIKALEKMGESMKIALAWIKFWGTDIGFTFAQGVAAGIQAGQYLAVNAAVQMVQAAEAAARAEAQTASPSKLFAKIGEFMSRGLVIGMERGTPAIAAASAGMVQTAASSVTNIDRRAGPVTVNINISGNADPGRVREAARDGVWQALRQAGAVP